MLEAASKRVLAERGQVTYVVRREKLADERDVYLFDVWEPSAVYRGQSHHRVLRSSRGRLWGAVASRVSDAPALEEVRQAIVDAFGDVDGLRLDDEGGITGADFVAPAAVVELLG